VYSPVKLFTAAVIIYEKEKQNKKKRTEFFSVIF
jgi:hypothetical protein